MKKHAVSIFYALLILLFVVGIPLSVSYAQDPQPPVIEEVQVEPPVGEDLPIVPPVEPGDIAATFASLTFVVQQLTGFAKPAWQGKENQDIFDIIAASFFSIILCVTFKLDIFAASGLVATEVWAKWILVLFTALLMVRSSGIVNDLVKASGALRVKSNQVLPQ